MKIDKNYKGLKNVGWRYEYEGSIVTEKALEIDLDMGLYVSGHIEIGGSIKAGGSIEAGGYIEAGGSIKAGGSIEAGGYCSISAGLYINCKGVLKFGGKCFAGVCIWKEITDEEKTITCGKLEGGTIEYGILVETGLENERKTELIKKADEPIAKAEELKQEAEKI